MEDKVTKMDIAEALYRGLQDAIELSAKAWGPKPAGKKLPRDKPSVFSVLEGHRPLKAGEKLQVGDKVVGRNTPEGQYHPDEVWETIHDKHGQLGTPVGTWTNIGKQYQRPISPQQTSSAPHLQPPTQAPAQVAPAAKPVSKIPDIGPMGPGDYKATHNVPVPHHAFSAERDSSGNRLPASSSGVSSYKYGNHS